MALYIAAGLVAVVLVVLGGLLVKPAPFPAPSGASRATSTRIDRVAIPDGLPAPVERWLRSDYPDGLPVAESVVMRGLGVMRIGPLSIPMRHMVEVRPGRGFVRRMDLTWYGIAVVHGRDTFVDGRGVIKTPVGTFDGAKVDQGANIVSWLELLSVPGVIATREDVRWEAIDDSSARLVFPFKDGEDSLTVCFDEANGKPVKAFAWRFKDADSAARKLGWTAGMNRRGMLGGLPVSVEIDATWDGDPRPWATFEYSDAWVNVRESAMESAAMAKEEGDQ